MPILNADVAKCVDVCKRSINYGFSGIGNELFYDHKMLMIFGDVKDSINKLIRFEQVERV